MKKDDKLRRRRWAFLGRHVGLEVLLFFVSSGAGASHALVEVGIVLVPEQVVTPRALDRLRGEVMFPPLEFRRGHRYSKPTQASQADNIL